VVAKEKKRERKRKRKEREREEWGGDGEYLGPTVAPLSGHDGYISPVFDPQSESEDGRTHSSAPPRKKSRGKPRATLEEEEELALKLLRR